MQTTDSPKQSSHILDKHVVLCRSGKQVYHKSELAGFITEDNKPPKEKEFYVEYRPPSVVVKAKELCRTLPVTREHPSEFVNGANFKVLAGGVTAGDVDVIALTGESAGEIGLSTDITFFSNDLFDYYNENNKEVSLGYECLKHFVDNPEEVGYDILLDDITSVNHLAITHAGRGGSSVAVVDHKAKVKGVTSKMRTNLFQWLFKGKQTDSFGQSVIDKIRNGEKDVAKALDSIMYVQDSDAKAHLVDMVTDCFEYPQPTLDNAAKITAELDAAYKAVVDSCSGEPCKDSEEKKDDGEKQTDSDTPADNSTGKKAKAEQDKKDKENPKPEVATNSDSAPVVDTKAVVDALRGELKELVVSTVKETLGVSVTDSKPKVEGGAVTDGASVSSLRDYSEFFE